MNLVRIEWIDVCKCFLISLVVFGHLVPMVDGNSAFINGIWIWLYSFHMPAFFIISGILKNRTDYLQRVKSIRVAFIKQKKIVKYYCIFSALALFFYFIRFLTGTADAERLYEIIIEIITLSGTGVLWFLPSYFFSELLFFLTFRSKMFGIVIGILLLCIIYALQFYFFKSQLSMTSSQLSLFLCSLYRVFIGYSFVIIGYWLDKYSFFSNRKKLWILGLCSLLCFFNGKVDLHTLSLNNIFLYYLFAITGTIALFELSQLISRVYINGNFFHTLTIVGAGSILIMCTHTGLFINQTVAAIINRLLININYNVAVIIAFIAVMFIEWVLVLVNNKYKLI